MRNIPSGEYVFGTDEIYEQRRAELDAAIEDGYRAHYVEKLVSRPTILPDGVYYDGHPQASRIQVAGGRVISATVSGGAPSG